MNVNVMDTLKQQKNRGYVIAGGAAIIAFIAFFLPYVSVSYLGISNSVSGSSGGWLWFEEIGALAAIAVSAVLIFRNNAFGLTNMPVEKQVKYGRYALIGAGALALLINLLFLIDYQSTVGGSLIGTTSGISVGLGFGYWVFMLAAIGMIVGAVMAYRQPIAAYAGAAAQPYGQYPGQSTQYPPYQQPYATGDQQPQYPPYQAPPQQYPAQQYPPQQPQYPAQPQQPYQQPSSPQYPPQQYPPAQPQQYPPTEMQQPPQQYPPQR